MWEWYRIGVAVGIGAGAALVAAGWLARTRPGALLAILSVGRIAERPVVRDGQVATAPIGYVSVTFDHRVVDGARAAQFGLDVIRRLETGS